MNELLINKNDLLRNIREIKARETQMNYTFIAVVKGNAYGLGIVPFTKFLIENGFRYFAVANIEEALLLRKNGIKENILLLTPYTDLTMLEKLIENDVTLTIDSQTCFEVIDKIAKKINKKVVAHIKIDTGLSRYGFNYEDITTIKKIVKTKGNVIFEGIYSHFSNSLAQKDNYSEVQYNRLVKVIDELKKVHVNFELRHICNSSGFFKYPHMHLNAARIGSAFIGYGVGITNNLKRIGLFHTKIMRIKDINKGDYIGYGNSYKAKKNMKIAILSTGYYEGIGLSIDTYRFRFLSKAKRLFLDVKGLFNRDIYFDSLKVIGQIGMHDVVIDITNTNYGENDDIYFYIKPVLIGLNVPRVYK